MLHFLQQNPVVIDVSQAPGRAARDISIDVVIGIFAMAGTFLAAAAVGSVLVAGAIILLKRWRDNTPVGEESGPSHIRLGI